MGIEFLETSRITSPLHAIARLQGIMGTEVGRGAEDCTKELSSTVHQLLLGSIEIEELQYSTADTLMQGQILLEHLYTHAVVEVHHALLYLHACLHLYCIEGGKCILLEHFEEKTSGIPKDIVEQYFDYREAIDKENGTHSSEGYIGKIMESQSLSYELAEQKYEEIVYQAIRVYIFLEAFYLQYIYHSRFRIDASTRDELKRMIQDIWTILSPSLQMSLDFLDENNDMMIVDPQILIGIFAPKQPRN